MVMYVDAARASLRLGAESREERGGAGRGHASEENTPRAEAG
jgi:hypothetical protein